MVALIEAGRNGTMQGEVCLVVGTNPHSEAIENAKSYGIESYCSGLQSDAEVTETLELLRQKSTNLICLAGFMRLLPTAFLKAFPQRVLNIHPALLPKFGGKGMYGRHVHEAVLASDEIESGCTVHYVTEHYDEGDIVLQAKCAVNKGDTAETLAARVLKLEHSTYPQAVNKVLAI